jgi:hypothetical protein
MTLDWINGLANIAQFAIPAAILVWADRLPAGNSATPPANPQPVRDPDGT